MLAAASGAQGSKRPAYGGELRVTTAGQLADLHPGTLELDAGAAALRLRLLPLVFETLVKVDSHGFPQPALAVSWTASSDLRRWNLSLRQGVRFHDGAPLDASAVVECLTSRENPFIVLDYNGRIVIESADPQPDLLLDLATLDRSIYRSSPGGASVGTGPFRIAEWVASQKGVLLAFEEHWQGRPFLDRVVLEMGRNLRDQWMDLELDRTDLIELSAEEVRSARERGHRILSSRPLELMALSVTAPGSSPQDINLRSALALSIDRDAIHRVLLQKQGEGTSSLLPQWITGFGFLFGQLRDLNRARSLLALLPQEPQLSIGYPARDRLAKSITDRLALDLQSAGIRIRPLPLNEPSRDAYLADVVLLRVPITTLDQKHALLDLASRLGLRLSENVDWNQPEAVFKAERALLKDFRVIPLFHLSFSYAVSKRVRFYRAPDIFLTDSLHLEDVWVAEETAVGHIP